MMLVVRLEEMMECHYTKNKSIISSVNTTKLV